ncbi:MAG: 4a-hydroxytetrahydrobiopterin dehydratase [Bacteroidales bacterium]
MGVLLFCHQGDEFEHPGEITQKVKHMSNWTEKENAIHKQFTFSGFVEAVEFVNRIVEPAEEMQHHPDVLIHGYKNVTITLTTHDKHKVTQKDYELAEKIDKLATQ